MTAAQTFNNRLLPLWTSSTLVTPAFVYDSAAIVERLQMLNAVRQQSGCHVLYSIKALSHGALLRSIAPHVDGFSVSSLFEARLAREILGEQGTVHLATPGITIRDMPGLAENCDYISFNSLTQWQRCKAYAGNVRCGLRINPGMSFVRDERYDPCRPASKLGVPLEQMAAADDQTWGGISGLHVHNNCEARDFGQLEQTIEQLRTHLPHRLKKLQWLNLGGGYLIENRSQLDVLTGVVTGLQQGFGLNVFFEPGKGIVGSAGYLVASVIDLFASGDKTIAVLDTTVNHLPEIFEYQYRPLILNESRTGQYAYRLAGASCLSGDLFGDYSFDRPLDIGSRIIIANMGAYMLVKASMFNGINLPNIYTLHTEGEVELIKEYTYAHYRDRL